MECPHIPIGDYSQFSRHLRDKAAAQSIPLAGSIEVTNRCNLRCAHCYINLPAGDCSALERELTYQELCNLFDQIVDEGCLWLLLTGGEPFVRPDFLDIYTYAKKKGLLITLFTNGTTITPDIADYLAEWRPFSTEITLYGRTRETYEGITGVPGSYERCMKGIELLLERKIPLKLKSMVLTLNKHELWDMKSYAKELGVDFRFDPALNMRLDGDKKPADFRIPPQEVVALYLADETLSKLWRELYDEFSEPTYPEYIYQCGAGVITFHVDSCGQLSACIMSRKPSYDLRSGATFHEGWCDFMPQVRTQRWSKETPCKNCELIALCDQCPGFAQIETGDQEEPVEYLCQIAHLRAKAFGFKGGRKEGNDEENKGKDNQKALSQATTGTGSISG